jgi:hypothetical protein
MGYRSEVAFAIHPDKVADFLAVLSTSEAALDLCRGSDNGIQTDIFMKGDMFIEISGIKWYDSYEEVEMMRATVGIWLGSSELVKIMMIFKYVANMPMNS